MKNVYIVFFETQCKKENKYDDDFPIEEYAVIVFEDKLQAELYAQRINDSLISSGYYLRKNKHNYFEAAYFANGMIYLRHMIDDYSEFRDKNPDLIFIDTNGARATVRECPMWG